MHAHSPRTANLVGAWSLVVADAVTRTTERETGLGGAVPAALVTIGAYRDQSIEELRSALGLSQPGTVRLVDRLVAEGWVRRAPGRRPRTVALALTPAGRRMTRRVMAARVEQVLERGAERVCRLCERTVCERCPVAEGSDAADEPPAAPRPA
jgi:MarR family transcriptional regulator, negative regulator of the multidrug operon emrRAB